MKKNKRRVVLGVALIVACMALAVYGIKFILDAPFRIQLPVPPDFKTISKPIQQQISGANRKAYWITTADNLGNLGMVYHSCANYEKAAACYKLAVKKDEEKWRYNYYLGYLYLEQGDSKAAIANFKHVMDKDPKNYLAFYYSGEAYQKLGSTDSAEILFKKIVAAGDADSVENIPERESYFPLKTYSAFQLARIYLNANHADSAETLLKAIIANQETFGPAYRLLGNVYSKKGNLPLADKFATLANDRADYTPPPDNQLDEIALMSRSDEYLLKEIDNAVRNSNYKWALKLCNQGMKYFPENKELISTVVFENFRQGNDEKALGYLDQHFNYYSNDAKELMDVTDLLYNKGYGDTAMRYFNQVKKLLPDNSSLAVWLYDRGKRQEAVVMMNDLIKRYPANIKILADVIRLSINMGDDELANEYFSNLKHLSPEGVETWKITGLMAEKRGDSKGALSAYEAAFNIDPKDILFIKELTDIDIREKNWEQAISHFRRALAVGPNEPVLLEGLGRLLISCNDLKFRNIPEGIEFSHRAFISVRAPYKTKLSAGKSLATAYVFLGDKKNAAKYINQTIALARQGNDSKEYIAYFTELVGKK